MSARSNASQRKAGGDFRQKFINTLFHELKAPISSINGYASLLLCGETGRLTPNQIKIVKRIKDSSIYVQELVSNLLSLSRLGSRKIARYEIVSLSDIINKAVIALKIPISSRRLKVNIRFKNKVDKIWALPLDIEQIIINLLSNAVKFTPKDGRINIIVNKTGYRLYLTVTDTGIGIPKEAMPRIFSDFYRADNAAKQYEGTGLGLSIVKRIVEYNKGSVRIKSVLNKGTSVFVMLPVLAKKTYMREITEGA